MSGLELNGRYVGEQGNKRNYWHVHLEREFNRLTKEKGKTVTKEELGNINKEISASYHAMVKKLKAGFDEEVKKEFPALSKTERDKISKKRYQEWTEKEVAAYNALQDKRIADGEKRYRTGTNCKRYRGREDEAPISSSARGKRKALSLASSGGESATSSVDSKSSESSVSEDSKSSRKKKKTEAKVQSETEDTDHPNLHSEAFAIFLSKNPLQKKDKGTLSVSKLAEFDRDKEIYLEMARQARNAVKQTLRETEPKKTFSSRSRRSMKGGDCDCAPEQE